MHLGMNEGCKKQLGLHPGQTEIFIAKANAKCAIGSRGRGRRCDFLEYLGLLPSALASMRNSRAARRKVGKPYVLVLSIWQRRRSGIPKPIFGGSRVLAPSAFISAAERQVLNRALRFSPFEIRQAPCFSTLAGIPRYGAFSVLCSASAAISL
jgi:hypothetical protein